MRFLTVLYVRVLFIESIIIYTASLSDEDAVYLIESVVEGLHICKRVRSLILFARAFNLHAKDRNDDRFAACL